MPYKTYQSQLNDILFETIKDFVRENREVTLEEIQAAIEDTMNDSEVVIAAVEREDRYEY